MSLFVAEGNKVDVLVHGSALSGVAKNVREERQPDAEIYTFFDLAVGQAGLVLKALAIPFGTTLPAGWTDATPASISKDEQRGFRVGIKG